MAGALIICTGSIEKDTGRYRNALRVRVVGLAGCEDDQGFDGGFIEVKEFYSAT